MQFCAELWPPIQESSGKKNNDMTGLQAEHVPAAPADVAAVAAAGVGWGGVGDGDGVWARSGSAGCQRCRFATRWLFLPVLQGSQAHCMCVHIYIYIYITCIHI